MPRLPQIISNQPLQTGNLSIGSAMAPGDAAARVGEQATSLGLDIAQRQVELQRSQRVMEKTAQGAEAASKLYDQILNDPSIPNDQIAQRVQDGFKILHDNIGRDIKDSQVRQNYDENFQALTTQHIVHAIGVQRDRIISSAKAALDESNDTLGKLAVDATGQEQDALIAQIHGNIASAVANKQLTAEQGQKELSTRLDEIQDAKGLKLIRTNPQAAIDFYKSDTEIDPVHKEIRLNQALEQVAAQARQAREDQRFAEEEAQKQRNDSIENDATQMRMLALDGKLTHQELTARIQKYDQAGLKPFPAAEAEHLFDLINKPLQQNPSDPRVLKAAELAVTDVNPGISKPVLADLYRKGALNLDDYTKLDNKLTENLHYNHNQALEDMRARQSMVKERIDLLYGGDPLVHEMALKDLSEASAAQGGTQDPVKILNNMRKTYDPMMVEMGGPSVQKSRTEFDSASKALESVQTQERNWDSGIHPIKHLGDNPYSPKVFDAKQRLVEKAKAAKKLVGPAKPGTPDGEQINHATGEWITVVNGMVITK